MIISWNRKSIIYSFESKTQQNKKQKLQLNGTIHVKKFKSTIIINLIKHQKISI